MAVNLYDYLKGNVYPGRGIAIGRTPCGKEMWIGYFIMGRSLNSRNRIFVEDGDGIRTQAYDESLVEDPSLIIYAPVRVYNGKTIVTNGDQTDTIYDFLKEGKTFKEALDTRTFEPDAPNYTPRISGIVDGSSYSLSVLKTFDGDPEYTIREYFDIEEGKPGYGHIIHTYEEDGNPIPSFKGEPVLFKMPEDSFEEFSQHLYEALNEENKVSLFTRSISLEDGNIETKIMNKNEE